LKPVIRVSSSHKDLRAFPEPVQDHMGYALYVAQRGGTHRDTTTLRGFGRAGVVVVVTDFRGDPIREVYTLRYTGGGVFKRSRGRPIMREGHGTDGDNLGAKV
jgi:phage-related protein